MLLLAVVWVGGCQAPIAMRGASPPRGFDSTGHDMALDQACRTSSNVAGGHA